MLDRTRPASPPSPSAPPPASALTQRSPTRWQKSSRLPSPSTSTASVKPPPTSSETNERRRKSSSVMLSPGRGRLPPSLLEAVDEEVGGVLVPGVRLAGVDEDHLDAGRLELLRQLQAEHGRVGRVGLLLPHNRRLPLA